MIRKYFIPLLAVAGLLLAVFNVVKGSAPTPISAPVAQPSKPTFTNYVAGAGIVEASTENIAIGSAVAGIVTKIHISVGHQVKAGDVLFQIDDRTLQAELRARQAVQQSARAKLRRLELLPRPEDIPPAKALVAEAKAQLADAQSQLKRWESVEDKRAVNEDQLSQKRFAVQFAEAKLQRADADLRLLEAGSWAPDLEIARSELAAAESQVKATETEIERHLVRAPVDGKILQLRIRVGEFAPAGALSSPLLLLGNTTSLHVRVDVDENDAWRVKPGAKATAFVRGNKELKTELEFVRIEPYVIPKRSLTGESSERVDTRVLQVLYRFDPKQLPVYVGQQMDIFIEEQK